tara:strand:+ start:1699 stop:2532 length:834 start_codon:yes stop_codon:yes gene_type:complete
MKSSKIINYLLLILLLIFVTSCAHKVKKVHHEEVIIESPEPIIENSYIESPEEKEVYDIKGFINRSKSKQISGTIDLKSMKFTAYLLEKLVCLNYLNNLFVSDIKAKFEPNLEKKLVNKYNHYWVTSFGSLVLKFGDKTQNIYGCGQIVFPDSSMLSFNNLKNDVNSMINILEPIAKQIISNEPVKKLSTNNFTNACKIFYENENKVLVLNYQKKMPELPIISRNLITEYKTTRLKTLEYINNSMFKGCTGQFIKDESYQHSIQTFIEKFIFCTDCD